MFEPVQRSARAIYHEISAQVFAPRFTKLRRIVRNAIDNAFKHCQEGKILVGVRRSREMVSIQVWDTGPGLDTYNKNASTSGSHIGNTVMFDLAQSIGASTEMNTVFYTRGIYRTGAFFELNLPVHRAKSVNASLVPKGVYNNGAKSFRQGYIVDTSPDGLCDELMVKLQQFGDNTCVLRLKTIIKNIDKRIYPSYVVVMVRDAANDVFLTDKVLASETQTFVPVIYVLAKSGLSMKIPSRPGIAVVPYAFAYPENILRTVASTASLLGKLDSTELDSKVPDDMASSSNPRRREPQIG